MYKLVVSLAFLAFASASLYGYQNYHVNVGAGQIVVTNTIGQQVHIIPQQKTGVVGHVVEIYVAAPHVGITSQPATFVGQYDIEVLYQIFSNFEGRLDEVTYEKLLHAIHQHVQDGLVHPAVLYALQILSHQYQNVQLVSPYHQEIFTTIQHLFHQFGYGQQVPYGTIGHLYTQGGYQHGVFGKYGGLYGLGKHQYYPGVYGQDFTQQYYGPYSSNVYGTHFGHGYGHHYGLGAQYPYGGIFSQLRGAVPYVQQHHLLA